VTKAPDDKTLDMMRSFKGLSSEALLEKFNVKLLKKFRVLPHSRCIWPHRRRWAFRCYMRADDFAAKFLKVTEGGTYLHRECGRAKFGPPR
jgi:hypothetical protein